MTLSKQFMQVWLNFSKLNFLSSRPRLTGFYLLYFALRLTATKKLSSSIWLWTKTHKFKKSWCLPFSLVLKSLKFVNQAIVILSVQGSQSKFPWVYKVLMKNRLSLQWWTSNNNETNFLTSYSPSKNRTNSWRTRLSSWSLTRNWKTWLSNKMKRPSVGWTNSKISSSLPRSS